MSLNPPITNWHSRVVWVIGASSGIGWASAHALHVAGAHVVVSARQQARLQAFVDEHPGARSLPLDVSDASSLRSAHDALLQYWGRIDHVLYSAGHYQPMRASEYELAQMMQHLQTNYVGVLNLLDVILPTFLQAQAGHLSLVGSVASYRGLPQSLAYGPTKAALYHLAQVLYLDLHERGIGVSIINPGFVDTQLTRLNEFPMPAMLQPAQAAQHMLSGWAHGDFEMNFPKRFTFWLSLMRHLPDSWYFPLVARVTGR